MEQAVPGSANGSAATQGTSEEALRRMAAADPELAAKLIVHAMPAAAAPLPSDLSWRLSVDGVGEWQIRGAENGGAASVLPANGADGEDFAIETDAAGLAALAGGSSPLGLMLRRKLRLRGARRKALALRKMDSDAGPRQLAKLGLEVDPDLLFRSLSYAIDPEWTRGQNFSVAYELAGEQGRAWLVDVNDGEIRVTAGAGGSNGSAPDATIRMSAATWQRLLSGELSPTIAMQMGLTRVEGAIYPVTLLGRWLDRAEGVDGPELEREVRQEQVQTSRAPWGSKSPTAPPPRAAGLPSATT